jgi:hypothetical protein
VLPAISISSYQAPRGSTPGPKASTADRLQARTFDGKKPAAAQDDEVLAVQLDDPALVDPGVLDVGNRIGRCGRFRGRRRRLRERLWGGAVVAARLLPSPGFLRPFVEQRLELVLAGEGLQGLARRGRVRGWRRHRQQRSEDDGENT